MSTTATELPKVEDLVTIEVDGQPLQARKGAMLMDVTDAAGIYIPRFCYHKKLSVAANCRMCLVEVERAPKPQPACATPVMDGMKVYTKSPKAVSGQQATMEFLLINHPLDCPICDQGGECELQDLALGYGSAVSQFTERKRVVRDKDIGPLVQTDMTRCIHCTRCVRFGEEIAGLRELGATGRGEHMEIGTYIAQAMTSELSGNVIDLCPVGALTSKPYRYSARAWELRQCETVAPHDCVGSRVLVHVKGQVVKRVVPGENEHLNETWISDRDRFAYEGLTSPDRLLAPRVKVHGSWQECDWDTALAACETALRGADSRIGALAAPSSTCEEMFLLQRLVRELGGRHVDHRLRQVDFSADDDEPLFPSLGGTLAELEQADTILVVGGDPRHERPSVNHRIRKAALRGARVAVLDTLAQPDNFDGVLRCTVTPSALVPALAELVAALADGAGATTDPALAPLLDALRGGRRVHVLAGLRVQQHLRRRDLLALLQVLARRIQARFGLLTEGANAAGAWIAGAVPHRGPAGRRQQTGGKHVADMFATPLDAYVLLGFEPHADVADPVAARQALAGARAVVALTAFTSPSLEQHCTVMLPIASFAENEGSFVNLTGDWQAFTAAVKAPGLTRPAWKILRALGERCGLPGFDAVTCEDVRCELGNLCGPLVRDIGEYQAPTDPGASAAVAAGLERVTQLPLYRSDVLVRRANALQQMPQAGDADVHLAPATLVALGLVDGAAVEVTAGGATGAARAVADTAVPPGCALLFAGSTLTAELPATSHVTLARGGRA